MIRQYFQDSKKKWIRTLLLMCSGLVFAFLINLSLGSIYIPLPETFKYLIGSEVSNDPWQLIISNFRFPKALTALLIGGALGISGLQMQTLFRNPLAGPFVLGISSGSGLGVAVFIFVGFYFGGFMEFSGIGRSWMLVVSAGLGSFLVLIIISVIANRIKESTTLLIIGLMFGAAASSIISILQFFSQAENIQAYVIWSFGSLGSLSWQELSIFIPIIIIGLTGAVLLSKPLNSLLLGENYARSIGLNLKKARLLIILNTSILAGTVTAFCGPIAFFGIALPHLTRMIFNTVDHKLLTPLIIIFGGILMLILDLISQLPGLESTLPINAITSLFGAPFVIYLLLRSRKLNYTFQS